MNIRPSLHFYGVIILVKKKGLCIGMTWLPFQKVFSFLYHVSIEVCLMSNSIYDIEEEEEEEERTSLFHVSLLFPYLQTQKK